MPPKKTTTKKTKRLTPKKTKNTKATTTKTKEKAPRKVATKKEEKKREEKIKEEVVDILEDIDELENIDDLEELGVDVVKRKPSPAPRVDLQKSLKKAPKVKTQSVGMYRKMAFGFIFLTLLLLAVVFYFSFVKVTIVIWPNKERISDRAIIDVYDKETGEQDGMSNEAIPGVVEKIEIKEEKLYKSTGSEVVGEEVIGTVTIVNNYSKNQPLVATTRLLSPKNQLFRIRETVNVPAGGSVDVEVYADEPDPSMALAPTKFTIPGLWAGLQDKIFAMNKEAFVYQEKEKKYITQDDIDRALADLKKVMLKKAEKEVGTTYKGFNRVIYSIDENSIETDVDGKVSDEKEEFFVEIGASVNVVAFSGEQLGTLARKKLVALVPSSKELLNFGNDNISYVLNSYDGNEKVATINASFETDMMIKDGTELVDRRKIVNLTKQQLEDYLDGFKEIAGYKINFMPAFIERVPNLVDRIEVKVEK